MLLFGASKMRPLLDRGPDMYKDADLALFHLRSRLVVIVDVVS